MASKKKKALITGASRGLGLIIARHLASKGYEVFGTSRNPTESNESKIQMLELDLNSNQSIELLASKFPDGVDLLINNAGQSQLGAFEDIPDEDFEKLFQINLFGSLRLTKLLLPKMRARGKGLIINISSLIASFPLPYYTSYSASKAAFSSFSFSLNMELKTHGIDVVLIEPNDLKTTIEPKVFSRQNSPYADIVLKMREKVRKNMSKSEDPRVILKVIDKILNSSKPKPKFVVGGNAGLLIFMKRLLTSAAQINLTGRSYKN